MTRVTELDTPVVTIRLDIMEANIRRVQALLDRRGIGNRPHIKTHKIPAIGKQQMAAGASGITCQKLGEVEVFADAGVADDVLLTYNIIGAAKAERLMAANRRIPRLTVALDNEVVARGLSEAAARAGQDLRFVIECDTGMGRTGVQTPQAAFDLARTAMALPRLQFRGPHDVSQQGPRHPGVLRGGAGPLQGRGHPRADGLGRRHAGPRHRRPLPHAHRASRRHLRVQRRHGGLHRHRGMGRLRHARARHRGEPAHGRARGAGRGVEGAHLRSVLHEGLRPRDGVPGGRRRAPLRGARGGGPLRFPERPKVGDVVEVVPNHCCVVSNMVDELHGVRGGAVEVVWPVAARGRVR